MEDSDRFSSKGLDCRMKMEFVAKRIIQSLAVFACMASTGYTVFMTFLIVSWFVDDSAAFTMTTTDWAVIAATNASMFSLVGIILGLFQYGGLRLVFGWRRSGKIANWPFRLAAVSTALVIVTAIWRAIIFFIEKPYM